MGGGHLDDDLPAIPASYGHKCVFSDVPIYSATTDGTNIVVSGGGGGLDYGIPDVTELYCPQYLTSGNAASKTKNEIAKYELTDSNSIGLLDSLQFSPVSKVFMGVMGSDYVMFTIDNETQSLKRFKRTTVIEYTKDEIQKKKKKKKKSTLR
eukprot:Trichotokara_eunicae@DN3311_c0_g1_i2.p1